MGCFSVMAEAAQEKTGKSWMESATQPLLEREEKYQQDVRDFIKELQVGRWLGLGVLP